MDGIDFDVSGRISAESSPNYQCHGARIAGVTFVGPMDARQPSNGVALANCRMPIVERCYGFGFTDGAPVVLYARGSGGMFKPIVRDCYFGHDVWISGTAARTESQMLYMCNRFGLQVFGPARRRGKINDLATNTNLIYNALESAFTTRPDETAGGNGNFGPGNLLFSGDMAYSEPVRKFREGQMTGGPTVWHLEFADHTPAHATDNFLQHDGLRFYLRAETTNGVEYRRIIGHDGDTVTVPSAWGGDLVSDDFRIMFTTDEIAKDNIEGHYPRFIDVHSNENVCLVAPNIEEFECPIVLHPEVRRLTLVAPRVKVSDGVFVAQSDDGELMAAINVIGGFDEWQIAGVRSHNFAEGATHIWGAGA